MGAWVNTETFPPKNYNRLTERQGLWGICLGAGFCCRVLCGVLRGGRLFGRGARGTAALPQNFGVKKLARTEKNSAYSPGFFITHATPVRKKYRVRGATCLGVDRATSGVFRVVANSLAIRRRRGGAPSAFI